MKNSTEYLFGVSKEFFDPELSIVAKKKIVTAQMVKSNMSKDEAFKHWTKILKEV